MFFIDDRGAREEVVSQLAAFIKEEGEEGGDEAEGTEKEDGRAFDARAHNCTKDGEGTEVDGVDGAEAAGAFAEGTAKEDFTEGEVDPEADELNFGSVAQGFEEAVLGLGHVLCGGGVALTPFNELIGPEGEFFKAFGMRLREEDFPNEERRDKGAEDEIEEEGEGANAETRGGHGALVV